MNPSEDPLVLRFAELMRERHHADLYFFGSRARGTAQVDSDYDLVAVGPFAEAKRFLRAPDRYRLWQQAGGRGIGLDLRCYTPDEFRRELNSPGYLGEARASGELIKIPTARAA